MGVLEGEPQAGCVGRERAGEGGVSTKRAPPSGYDPTPNKNTPNPPRAQSAELPEGVCVGWSHNNITNLQADTDPLHSAVVTVRLGGCQQQLQCLM